MGSVEGDNSSTTQYTLDEQRRDHAEARLQDLIAKKDDLMSKYDDVLYEIASTKQYTPKNTSKTSPLPEYVAKPKPAETKESESNFCDNCGKSLKPTAKFCRSCGTRID